MWCLVHTVNYNWLFMSILLLERSIELCLNVLILLLSSVILQPPSYIRLTYKLHWSLTLSISPKSVSIGSRADRCSPPLSRVERGNEGRTSWAISRWSAMDVLDSSARLERRSGPSGTPLPLSAYTRKAVRPHCQYGFKLHSASWLTGRTAFSCADRPVPL